MAREPSPGPVRPGQKRQWDTVTSCSNCDLDYKLYQEDVPHRVYEYQWVPPLINHVPVKIGRTHKGMGVKRSFSSHKAPRKSHVPQGHKSSERRGAALIRMAREGLGLKGLVESPAPGPLAAGQPEALHSIRGELSRIKAQVDRLLERLEHMDQLPGTEDGEDNRGPGVKGSSHSTTEPQQEPRGCRAHQEAGSPQDSRDPEEAWLVSWATCGLKSHLLLEEGHRL
ncbi:uncharacterized protein LOC119055867 isoform X2 [Artibeus jamaicensis]|uniref:uncharacterized protein LOC119055867 isoform X2 n=1 Tax=Artibeus jamaicensis TaxID=9417 RepID=UPI00235A6310|nr:uncharacterized protein LOC119055867 isoform X2 [Artibeus jamaicensis]